MEQMKAEFGLNTIESEDSDNADQAAAEDRAGLNEPFSAKDYLLSFATVAQQ